MKIQGTVYYQFENKTEIIKSLNWLVKNRNAITSMCVMDHWDEGWTHITAMTADNRNFQAKVDNADTLFAWLKKNGKYFKGIQVSWFGCPTDFSIDLNNPDNWVKENTQNG